MLRLWISDSEDVSNLRCDIAGSYDSALPCGISVCFFHFQANVIFINGGLVRCRLLFTVVRLTTSV